MQSICDCVMKNFCSNRVYFAFQGGWSHCQKKAKNIIKWEDEDDSYFLCDVSTKMLNAETSDHYVWLPLNCYSVTFLAALFLATTRQSLACDIALIFKTILRLKGKQVTWTLKSVVRYKCDCYLIGTLSQLFHETTRQSLVDDIKFCWIGYGLFFFHGDRIQPST